MGGPQHAVATGIDVMCLLVARFIRVRRRGVDRRGCLGPSWSMGLDRFVCWNRHLGRRWDRFWRKRLDVGRFWDERG
jgi:hypothetical protein